VVPAQFDPVFNGSTFLDFVKEREGRRQAAV
jgi:hypothetical protein